MKKKGPQGALLFIYVIEPTVLSDRSTRVSRESE